MTFVLILVIIFSITNQNGRYERILILLVYYQVKFSADCIQNNLLVVSQQQPDDLINGGSNYYESKHIGMCWHYFVLLPMKLLHTLP